MERGFSSPRMEAPGGPRPIDFRAELNPAQYEAVTTVEGPVLVVAGAGSGKTRTLVYRVAYLVDQGVPPETILLLTFTRKAAGEMLSRAQALVGERCARVSGGTFHSRAHELLRRWAGSLGYARDFGVMDRGDMEEVLGRLRREAGIKDRRFPQRRTLAEVISKAANKGLELGEVLAREYVHLLRFAGEIQALAREYAAYKKENVLFDFDDLLSVLIRLLRDNPPVREKIAGQYQYLMVDEYQDTNPLQAQIVYLLAQDHHNVMVVGDDSQSIYSFRGASFKNIMDFPAHFARTRIIRLEENYRSRQPLLEVTNHIIAQAREKYEKRLFSRREGGQPPRLLILEREKEQSLLVCRKVREFLAAGLAPGHMAVLFRAARHSYDLEMELLRQGIAYVKYGGRRFLEAAHIKDLLALLRVVGNPRDRLGLTRSLLLLEKVGPATAAKIAAWVGGRRERLVKLDEYPGSARVVQSLAPLARLFGQIAPRGVPLQDRVARAWEFYRPLMEEKFDDYPNRALDVAEFLRLARGYSSLARLLADVALEPPEATRSGAGPSDEGRVILSTVHSAKGLEWPVVFVIWAAEGRFPSPHALRTPEDLDEERRLMYVAATRARDDLYLLCPLEAEAGTHGLAQPALSRFLAQVPPELFLWEDEVQTEAAGPKPGRAGPPPAPPPEGFAPAERVEHPVFGRGRVLKRLEGRKVRVDFDRFGRKTLHLDYAGLRRVGK